MEKWRRVRKEVLKLDHKECCDCKADGRYRQATTVHHINYVKSHPELALEIMFVNEQGELERNLISLCHDCHEKGTDIDIKIFVFILQMRNTGNSTSG